MFEVVVLFLTENAVVISGVTGIVGAGAVVLSPIRKIFVRKKTIEQSNDQAQPTQVSQETLTGPKTVSVSAPEEVAKAGILALTLDDYEKRIADKIAETETKLTTAHDEEKAVLQQQIEELTRRAQNPEAALAEAQDTIRKLEDTLEREGNEIGEARMREAREALEAGDFSIADDIFAEIEAREQLAVERAARAAFARGEIAEQEIRWADAAEHYYRATELTASSDNLSKAGTFAWKAGKYELALEIDRRHTALEKETHGKFSEEYALALGDQATDLSALGRYDEAEAMFLRSIEIAKATIGENHSKYAVIIGNFAELLTTTHRLDEALPLREKEREIMLESFDELHPNFAIATNNLASVYFEMGQYAQAEPLYENAIEIGKATIGENHPEYAMRIGNLAELFVLTNRLDEALPLRKKEYVIMREALGGKHPHFATATNNLATLYYRMGRYDEAEPLYKQAIEIDEATLGPDHPQTKRHKSNLAHLQNARDGQ